MSSSTTPTMETGSVQVCVQPWPLRVDGEVNFRLPLSLNLQVSLFYLHQDLRCPYTHLSTVKCFLTSMHCAAQGQPAILLLLFQMKGDLGFRIMNCLSGVSDRFVSNIRREVEYYLVSNGNCVSLPAPLWFNEVWLGLKTHIGVYNSMTFACSLEVWR